MKKEKQKYCKKCGAEIDLKTKKCMGCGKQYIKLKPMPIIFSIILIVAVISLSSVIILQNNKISLLNKNIQDKNIKIENLNKNIKEQQETISNKWDDVLKANFLDRKIAFVCDGTNYYHTYDCKYFKNCHSYNAYNIEAIKAQGYKRHTCWNN